MVLRINTKLEIWNIFCKIYCVSCIGKPCICNNMHTPMLYFLYDGVRAQRDVSMNTHKGVFGFGGLEQWNGKVEWTGLEWWNGMELNGGMIEDLWSAMRIIYSSSLRNRIASHVLYPRERGPMGGAPYTCRAKIGG